MPRPHVLIIGAGFGGLAVARALRGAPVRATVVDRHNYHTFLPLLYQVATAGLEPQDIAYPVRGILRRLPNAVYRMAEIVGGDLSSRYVETAEAERLGFDFLVLAAGSAPESRGLPGVDAYAHTLHSVDQARGYRNHLLRTLEAADWERDAERRRAALTLVIVGGGATGVETAGALAEMRRHVVPADYPGIDPADLRILLLEASDTLLAGMPPTLRARALKDARALGIEVRLGAAVQGLSGSGVELTGGEVIPARAVLWAAGVRGAAIGERLGLPTIRGGRVQVTPSLRVSGHAGVYVIGDLACVEGSEGLPLMAPVAVQQGRAVARDIVRALAGSSADPPCPFRYRDQGQLATIGRSRAVAHVHGVQFTGRLAWWVWLGVHLIKLVGFRNRLVVLVNWAYSYLTYDRGVRSIVGAAGREGPHGGAGPAAAERGSRGEGTR